MDAPRFDSASRALGAALSRRRGLGAALGILLGAGAGAVAVADADADARRGRGRGRTPGPEGPCGNLRRKDNLCTRNSECCTGICEPKPGEKNRDGIGRCRCVRRGGACKADRNCCRRGDQQMVCIGGICGAPVPAQTCTVCARGCPYTTVLAAIAGEPANAVITIAPGTYVGDYVIVKSVTLARCGVSGEVILTNASPPTSSTLYSEGQGRVISLGTAPDFERSGSRRPRGGGFLLTLDSISVVGNAAFPLGGGIFVGAGATVWLIGDTVVRGARHEQNGGGVLVYHSGALLAGCDRTANPACTDNVVIGDADPSRANVVTRPDGFPYPVFGGGISATGASFITLRGNAQVLGNAAEWGAGINVTGSTSVTITDDASISGNLASINGAGLDVGSGCSAALLGNARISGNIASGFAGGVRIIDSTGLFIDSPDVRITGNTATGPGGGIYQYSGLTTISGVAAFIVIGNTGAPCANYYQYDEGNNPACVLA
ncbi:MAG: hypothetical protein ACKOWF_18670 [Chloroflexota bacterium]